MIQDHTIIHTHTYERGKGDAGPKLPGTNRINDGPSLLVSPDEAPPQPISVRASEQQRRCSGHNQTGLASWAMARRRPPHEEPREVGS